MVSYLTITVAIFFSMEIPMYGHYQSEEIKTQLANFYNNKNVLVTGGCGFIGSHIVELLVSFGAHVTILDDLSTGSLNNINNVKEHVHLIQGSIIDPKICRIATTHQHIIFHLAAFTSVPDSVARPEICHTINVDGTFNILNAARLNHVQRCIFSSSSAVYGKTMEISRETDQCSPTSPYGASKLIGEILCSQFSKNYGIKTIYLRYFNVYGPRQNPNAQYAAVVAKFSDCMSKNQPLVIFGDGKQTRDFVHVMDVAHANLIAGMLLDERTNDQAYNIASGKSINLFELISNLKKQFPDYQESILFKPARPGDVLHTQADCKKFDGDFLACIK